MITVANDLLTRLIDRQDILDCLTRFCRGIDRFDRALFLSAFHEDATIAAGNFVGGPAALCDWSFDLHQAGQHATQHAILNHTCEIDGDTAHTETYYQFIGRNRDDSMWIAGGRYIDRLERRLDETGNSAWRIALRTNAIEWSCMPPAVPLPFADVPDLHGNGEPSRSQADPSYTRPLLNQRDRSVPEGY